MTGKYPNKPQIEIYPPCSTQPEQVTFADLCTALGAAGIGCDEACPDFVTEINHDTAGTYVPGQTDNKAA